MLKVPREEFDRITNEKNIKISIDVMFFYEDESEKLKSLSDGSVLKSGESYTIYIKPSDICYMYIYQVDSLGKSFRLFPNSEFNTAANPLSPGNEYWMPNPKQLFVLDETTGKENFYIFASLDKIDEFEGDKSVNLAKTDLDNIVAIKRMGVSRVKDKRDTVSVVSPKKEIDVVEIKKKLQAEGSFIYETWFWHK
ncbi:MAG: DUF4384 domain-containing protein [Candidatus Firestonebacteria bacterium]